MKSKLLIISIFLFFFILLGFPNEAMEGSRNGLLLWFHTVLPTLLPFIILTNFIIKLDIVPYICGFIMPVMRRLFGVSIYGCYALITGFLCGYPMGAKITADLVRDKRLSLEEGNFLLSVCNNASPMFFLSFVIDQSLHASAHKAALLLILYGTPIFYAFCTKPTVKNPQIQSCKTIKTAQKPQPFTFQIVDDSIMNGFETITRLGGYIILFAIIAKMATAHLTTVTILNPFIIGVIEITNGIHALGCENLPLQWQIPVATAIISLGGLSGLAQTKSMIHGTKLSLSCYICKKIILSCISTSLALLYSLLFVA